MPAYVDVKGISEDGKRFIEYVLSLGFDFFEFVEEPLYAKYLKSHPSGVTARYHFIEMITEGGHGIDRPMTDGEIVSTHTEMKPSQVTELRQLYQKSKNRRPFKQNLETTIVPIPALIITGARTFADDFSLYFKTTRPLKTFISKIPIGSSGGMIDSSQTETNVRRALTSVGRSTSKFVGTGTPPVGVVGDLWLNTGEGKLFMFMTDGSNSGTTTAWVEV
tara:strand:+ start:306 stop:965 length:660 start_codon:yes stop_codon:yes gene_type:complete